MQHEQLLTNLVPVQAHFQIGIRMSLYCEGVIINDNSYQLHKHSQFEVPVAEGGLCSVF